MNAADLLNRQLNILDQQDAVYKALIADPDGVAAVTITDPKDYNKGGIANLLEWLWKFVIELKVQNLVDQADTDWLDYIAENMFAITRYESESDSDYVSRIKSFILDKKISPASIIYATIPYSSPGLPVMYEGESDGAYADISYAGNITRFFNTAAGPDQNTWVLPALTIGQDGGLFNFVLVLQNTPATDIRKVLEICDRWKAGGITYQVWIETV